MPRTKQVAHPPSKDYDEDSSSSSGSDDERDESLTQRSPLDTDSQMADDAQESSSDDEQQQQQQQMPPPKTKPKTKTKHKASTSKKIPLKKKISKKSTPSENSSTYRVVNFENLLECIPEQNVIELQDSIDPKTKKTRKDEDGNNIQTKQIKKQTERFTKTYKDKNGDKKIKEYEKEVPVTEKKLLHINPDGLIVTKKGGYCASQVSQLMRTFFKTRRDAIIDEGNYSRKEKTQRKAKKILLTVNALELFMKALKGEIIVHTLASKRVSNNARRVILKRKDSEVSSICIPLVYPGVGLSPNVFEKRFEAMDV